MKECSDSNISTLNISMDNMSKNDACSQLCQTILCQKYLTCGRGVVTSPCRANLIKEVLRLVLSLTWLVFAHSFKVSHVEKDESWLAGNVWRPRTLHIPGKFPRKFYYCWNYCRSGYFMATLEGFHPFTLYN